MRLLLLALLLFCSPALAATTTDGTVGSYHGAPDRSGHYIVPGLTWQSAKDVRRDAAFDGRVEGHIYAQPLYWRPDMGRSLIITATESNIIFALDATTGAVVWRSGLGRPVSRQALTCGNIDPVGVTGTPVIDQ